jgi:RNA polymerase sigma-70 factor (ECF subfamily)
MSSSKTQSTLLERLRDGEDALAWSEFSDRYWRLVFSYARRRGCSDHTAEDVVQEVMLVVFTHREVFRYDRARGRFRSWLGALVQNTVAKRRRQPADRIRGCGGDQQEGILAVEADEAEPDAAWEAAFDDAILATLLDEVRREVTPQTYQAFELTALQDLPGDQVAEITGLRRNAVYAARLRVVRRLQELGAFYREDGQLTERLKQALASRPSAAVERSVVARIEETDRRGVELNQ